MGFTPTCCAFFPNEWQLGSFKKYEKSLLEKGLAIVTNPFFRVIAVMFLTFYTK